MNYRNEAHKCFDRAKELLSVGHAHSLRYAAIELRMVFESLIYERANNYKLELPIEKINTWQPKQILEMLIKIDPLANQDMTLSVGVEESYGVESKDMKTIGSETALSLKDIKKYYNKLGSYLHAPTIKQLTEGKDFNPEKTRNRCIEIVEILEKVLASSVFNINIKQTTEIDCMRCNNKIVRRITSNIKEYEAQCLHCDAEYTINIDGDNICWKENTVEMPCTNKDCSTTKYLYKNEVKLGSYWVCTECNTKNILALCITNEQKQKNG